MMVRPVNQRPERVNPRPIFCTMLAGKFIVSKIAAIFFTSVVQKSSQFNVQAEQKLALAVAVAALIRQVIGRILLKF